jgi:hypothetical protein
MKMSRAKAGRTVSLSQTQGGASLRQVEGTGDESRREQTKSARGALRWRAYRCSPCYCRSRSERVHANGIARRRASHPQVVSTSRRIPPEPTTAGVKISDNPRGRRRPWRRGRTRGAAPQISKHEQAEKYRVVRLDQQRVVRREQHRRIWGQGGGVPDALDEALRKAGAYMPLAGGRIIVISRRASRQRGVDCVRKHSWSICSRNALSVRTLQYARSLGPSCRGSIWVAHLDPTVASVLDIVQTELCAPSPEIPSSFKIFSLIKGMAFRR